MLSVFYLGRMTRENERERDNEKMSFIETPHVMSIERF